MAESRYDFPDYMPTSFNDNDLVAGVERGDVRCVTRLISLCENRIPRARLIQGRLFSRTGRAQVVGVTGSPGAGKSTLVDQLAKEWHEAGRKVAVLAIDPSSPFSGGAILGDRIRMVNIAEHAGIFMRSMASRGALGGLSRATADAIQVLDAAGYDLIIIETVGVGQAEVDIARTADTCIVVLVPGMGDGIQAIKAGILEIADLFVVNKADRDGADLVEKDLLALLNLTQYESNAWRPAVLRSVAISGQGAEKIRAEVAKHHEWLKTSARGVDRKRAIVRDRILALVTDLTLEQVLSHQAVELESLVEQCLGRRIDPAAAAEKLFSAR